MQINSIHICDEKNATIKIRDPNNNNEKKIHQALYTLRLHYIEDAHTNSHTHTYTDKLLASFICVCTRGL